MALFKYIVLSVCLCGIHLNGFAQSTREAILEDIGCGSQKLPLYKVSVCNAIILSNDNWDRSFLPVVRENRKQCHTLLMFWEERYGYNVRKPMDFVNYQKYCAHFVDWDMKDLLEEDLDKLVGMGYE